MLQDYVNSRYNREGYTIVVERFLNDVHYPFKGLQFKFCDQLYTLEQVINEYHFSDIKKSDVALDIGANIGGFSLLAAKFDSRTFNREDTCGIQVHAFKK